MPLTRHFYALDEVQAAIYYCGGRPSWKETVFWCRELALSGHASEAISALFESWLWNRGPFHMRWLMEAMARLGGEEVGMEAILEMAEALSRCPVKDHSLWTMLVASVLEGEADRLFDRVTPRTPSTGIPFEEREVFMIRALYQHKAGAAWWAAEGMATERVESLLEWYEEHVLETEAGAAWKEALRGYDRLLGYRSDAYDRAILGVRLLGLCLTADQREKSMADSPPPLYQKEEAEWDRVLGRKAGRVMMIPVEGLYGVTLRGRIRHQDTTMGELWDVLRGMKGCAYWEEIGIEIEDLEHRYLLEGYFPDDLPDEWTAEEKGRSHGAGQLGRGESVTLWGWMRRYMTGTTRLLWGRGCRLLRRDTARIALDRISLADSPFLTLLSLPRVGGCVGRDTLFAPVHKRKVVG